MKWLPGSWQYDEKVTETTTGNTGPAADHLAVDDRVCLALYAASRAMTARYRPLLTEFDLTYPQFMVLAVLWEGGPQDVTTVAERLSLDASTLSPLLKRLESSGKVTRKRDVVDERRVIVDLTEAGAALEQRTSHIPSKICEATGLESDALADLVSQVKTLTENIGASQPRI